MQNYADLLRKWWFLKINWNKDIELFEGISMNLGDYLAKMNVELE